MAIIEWIAETRRRCGRGRRPSHGDLQVDHVFVDGDQITGVIDWSEASRGDALFDLASMTLGHEEQLGHVVAGYGTDVDLDVIRGWWSGGAWWSSTRWSSTASSRQATRS